MTDSNTESNNLSGGDPCPNCQQGTLQKPVASKPKCPWCKYVHGSSKNDRPLKDFDLTVREAKRLLEVFGYDTHGSAGDLGNRLRRFCDEQDIQRADLNGLLRDLRGETDG